MGCGASRVHPIAQTRPLSGSELAALRDARGALSEQAAAQLRRAAFERGVAPDARAGPQGAWPLLLGVFPMGSTTAEREELMAQKTLAYEEHRAAGAALAADPAFKDGSVIVHDVHRTQADHQLHEAHKPLMTEVLRAYAAFDPDVGYGQGMSDMLAVILYSLEDAALSFWCDNYHARQTARHDPAGSSGLTQSWVRLCTGASLPCCVGPRVLTDCAMTTRGGCILQRT